MKRRPGPRRLAPLLLVGALSGRADAQARRIAVGTDDPALAAALRTVFVPRGADVTTMPAPLRGVEDGDAVADPVVWLCEAPGGRSLCIREPGHGTVVRGLPPGMSTPLSPADAAALALSVEVALLHTPAPAALATERGAATPPAPTAPVTSLPNVTLELGGGVKGAPAGIAPRVSIDLTYAPDWSGRRLAFGSGVSTGTAVTGPPPRDRQMDRGGREGDGVSISDATLRLFGRARLPLGRTRVELEAGPAARLVSADPPGPEEVRRRVDLAMQAGAGVVVPFGTFFGGVRLLGDYALSSTPDPEGGPRRWSWQAGLTVGLGF